MEYLNDLESKLVLGSTLGTETRGEGSRAASQTHRDVERDIMEADVKRLETSVNRDLIRPIVDLNYGRPPNGVYPRLRIGLPDNDDVSAWVKNVKDLAESGMKIGVKNIYEKMHLTAPEEGEPVLTPPERVTVTDDEKSPSGKPPLGKPPAGKSGEPAPDKSGDTTEEPTQETSRLNISSREDPHGAADELTETIMARWRPVMGPMVDPVLRAIKQAKSYDDLKGRLKKIAPEMDPSGLRDMMSKALFASLMAGRTGLKLE
jgi:phage gp29-like protein